ncbi:hypothetical protein RJT34_01125 [Clitoria ternatea]|uniref:Uncharacterized protein n=1 Tax=Clitoria ternatea TaxID=43366 RepID=A0AAN9KHV8_CLITE
MKEEEAPSLNTTNLQDMVERNRYGSAGKQSASQEKVDHILGNYDSEPTINLPPSKTNTPPVGNQIKPIPPTSFNNTFTTNTPDNLSYQFAPHVGKQNEPIPLDSFKNTSTTKTLESLNFQSTPLVGSQSEPIPPESLDTFSTITLDSLGIQPGLHLGNQNEPIPPNSFKNTFATKTLDILSFQIHQNPCVRSATIKNLSSTSHHSPEKK